MQLCGVVSNQGLLFFPGYLLIFTVFFMIQQGLADPNIHQSLLFLLQNEWN